MHRIQGVILAVLLLLTTQVGFGQIPSDEVAEPAEKEVSAPPQVNAPEPPVDAAQGDFAPGNPGKTAIGSDESYYPPGVLSSPLSAIHTLRDGQGFPVKAFGTLPGPQDPNDQQNAAADGTSSLQSFALVPFWRRSYFAPDAATFAAPEAAAGVPVLEIGFQVRPGVFFDTGSVGGADVFNPGDIALDYSVASHQNGQLFFRTGNQTGTLVFPYRPQAALTFSEAVLGSGTAAINFDAISTTGDDLHLRTGAVRYVDTHEELAISFGKIETAFGDLGTASGSIITGALPVGTVTARNSSNGGFAGVGQLRVSRYWHSTLDDGDIFEAAISAEDPRYLNEAVIKPFGVNASQVTVLNRYPALVGRLRYGGSNGWDSYQLGGLVMPIGFENHANFHEAFSNAYGISANARLEVGQLGGRRDTLYFGAAAGKGIGAYIFGSNPGAFLTANATTQETHLVTNVGAYASYRRVWNISKSGEYLSSNFMGSLTQNSSTPLLGSNRQLYQAGANLIWHKTESTLFGLEYQYGSREAVIDPTTGAHHGESHRIMFVMQFAPMGATTVATKGSEAKSRQAPRSDRGPGTDPTVGASTTSSKPRLRF